MLTPARCINLDWLEVFAHEPADQPHDAEYYRRCGLFVQERDYGTRVYAQMFTIEDEHGHPWIEVRRQPLSAGTSNAIFNHNDCHLRLVNRQCYADDAILRFASFCDAHHYDVSRISRIDIALDFIRFDSGDYPREFIRRYIAGKFTKINQANVHAHGTDSWASRDWNSISWGARTSQIGTKLYNKSKELAEVKDKPYIRQAWFLAGLVDNPQTGEVVHKDGTTNKPDVWRLEFSIKSSVKGWMVIERDGNRGAYQSIRNTLQMYDSRDKLLSVFSSLVQHYFHFKHFQNSKSKYECKDKELFRFGAEEKFYKVEHPASTVNRSQELERLAKLLELYRITHTKAELVEAADTLLAAIRDEDLSRFSSNIYSKAELFALQQAISMRCKERGLNPVEVVRQLVTTADNAGLFF